ncbi:MAG TPA: biopolymer transporter ExbD [Acidobacteriota bacterium]|nr:biopolymer transporter ExbD [Acidobacteriota bacterium]
MGADVGGDRHAGGKKGGKKKAKRVAIRLDMTPMVDVAFLLLIFYMVTTVFRTPQALELSLPPKGDKGTQIGESKVLTLRVMANPGSDPRIYWSRGNYKPEPVAMNQLGRVLNDEKTKVDDLITLIKIDRATTYETMVRVTDELGLANLTKFSLVPMTDDDRKAVSGL